MERKVIMSSLIRAIHHRSEDAPLQLQARRGNRGASERPETPQAGEEVVCGGDVARDLGAEFFWSAEFFFVAKAFPEAEFDTFGGGGI